MTPSDRRYAESHEWVRIEGNLAMVGISDYAQQMLGDITFVELPQVGSAVKPGGECGVIESVKIASDLYAPVGGEVAEVNHELGKAPELVNQDPYGTGWIFKLKHFNAADMDKLLDAAGYDKVCKEKQE